MGLAFRMPMTFGCNAVPSSVLGAAPFGFDLPLLHLLLRDSCASAAIHLTPDTPRLLGPAHRGLAHADLPSELPITARAHPYKGLEVKS